MVNIAIYHGEDVHTASLYHGLRLCGHNVQIVKDPIAILDADYHFIDASFKYDLSRQLKGEKIFIYDCEDSPLDYKLDSGFYCHEHLALAYCKMNYIKGDISVTKNLKLIAIPLEWYFRQIPISKIDISSIRDSSFIPSIWASPTYIGNYQNNDLSYLDRFKTYHGINPLALIIEEDKRVLVYNQRIHWLLDLYRSKVKYEGGIVFGSGNLSIEHQRTWHGKVELLKTDGIHPRDHLVKLVTNKIALCPSGHGRISPRVYDAMGAGCIPFITKANYTLLYNPEFYIQIEDTENIVEVLNLNEKYFSSLYQSARVNREIFQKLTPEKVWKDFLSQIY